MELAIDTEHLTKRYGRNRGVDDLDLDVRTGEVFGFLGPNGAGKSTTIHLLVGQLRPTEGYAEVLGLDSWRQRNEVHRSLGFLPGELAMYKRLTGRQMLEYLASLRGGVSAPVRDALVERFSAELDRPIHELSMGNKQKLGLVQAFMHEPALVVLDEPTLGLDPLVQREFQHVVREVRAEGRTVFLSSHRLSEVERIADRVGIIRDGRLVETAEVPRLKSLGIRHIELEFALPVAPEVFASVEGVSHVEVDGHVVRLDVAGPVTKLIKVAADHELIDIHTHEADLEDVFLNFYREPETEPPTEPRGERP